MNNKFLYKEYESSYEQLRFYDEKQSNLLKYVSTLTSSVVTALFAIFKFIGSPTQDFFFYQSFLCFIMFFAILLIYLSMIKNRLYFVFTARQLNAIRKFFLDSEASEFKDNQLYTSTDFSAAQLASVHSFQLLGVSLISSLFLLITVYSFYRFFNKTPCWLFIVSTFFIILIIEIIGGYKYLDKKSQKSADEAVHNEKTP